jgi:hypothetical protein
MNNTPSAKPFGLCDYNGLLAEGALTNPAAGERQGKFMLVEYQGITRLIMGSVSVFPYHADLLERFCRDNHILCDWTKRPAHLTIRDPRTHLHGGGWVQVESAQRRVTFAGRSTAYGPFDRALLSSSLTALALPPSVSVSIG